MPMFRTVKGTGEIVPYKWAEYITAFLSIPKEYLANADVSLRELPRTKRSFTKDRKVMDIVESDYFINAVIDVYAFMVWPYLTGGKDYMEIYSGYDPAWMIAHKLDIWVMAFIDLKIIPTSETWLEKADPDEYMGYVPFEEMQYYLSYAVPYAMEKNNLKEMIDCVEQHRCFEDFDYRKSARKTQFVNAWYLRRTKHPIVSLDDIIEDYEDGNEELPSDLLSLSANFENEIATKDLSDRFLATLSERDRQILELRLEGATLEKISERLGYANHSGVLKRIRKIGKAFEEYADVDYGFDGRHII